MDVTTQLQRIAWAATTGSRLAQSIQAWLASEPWAITAKIADDRLSYSVRFDLTTQPPLDDWGYMFGDAVHNLRAALDNSLVNIATQSGITDEKKLRQLQFPIAANLKEWKENASRVKELPQHFQDAILKAQPFSSGPDEKASPDDLLVVLRDLNNEDKHRVELTASLRPTAMNHFGSIEFETEEGAGLSVPPDTTVYTPSFIDGGTLLIWRTKGRIAKVTGGYTILAQVQVRLVDGRLVGVTQILAALCHHTEKVLRSVAD
jgi:hypothetical protein